MVARGRGVSKCHFWGDVIAEWLKWSIQSLLFAKNLQESQIQSSKTDAEGKKITKKLD